MIHLLRSFLTGPMLSFAPLPRLRADCLLQFAHCDRKLACNPICLPLLKLIAQRAIVPECAVATAAESFPDRFPILTVIGNYSPDVMELVGRRYQARFRVLVFESLQ